MPETSPRERRVLLVYGLIAGLGSFMIAAYVLVSQGSWLIQIGQPIPFMLLSVLVGAKFRRRYRRAFRPGAADPEDDEDDIDVPDIQPQEAPEAPKKREKKKVSSRWKRRLFWLAIAGIAALAVFFGRVQLRIAGPFSVLPEQNADVRASVDGIVDQILVNEGDEVRQGQVIARLAAAPLQNDLQKNRADLSENRATLKKLESGPTVAEVEVATATVAKAKDQATFLRARVPRYEQLLNEGLLSRMAFEEAQQAALMAENDLDEAQRRLALLLMGTRPEDVQVTRARLDGLDAQRGYIERQLGFLDVTSPIAGSIATPALQLRQMNRQFVKTGDLIAQVYDISTVSVDILVSEKDIADVHVGQPVVIRARAYPDVEFRGEVSFIATSAQGSSGARTASTGAASIPHAGNDEGRSMLVTTRMANPDRLLKPEMTGQAKILCGERRIVELIERRVKHTLKVEFWSWW
jgi:multidrug resistance efflux pump